MPTEKPEEQPNVAYPVTRRDREGTIVLSPFMSLHFFRATIPAPWKVTPPPTPPFDSNGGD